MHFLEILIEMLVHALDAIFPQNDKTKQHHFVGVFLLLIFLTAILLILWIFLN
jgi:hypothetical protein